MSLGMGQSKTSSSSQNYGSGIDATQLPFLQNLWGAGQGMMQSGGNQAMGQQGYDQAMGALGSPYMQQSQQTLQRMQNPGMDPMMDVYSRQIGQQFREQILPGINDQARVGGGYGGSRAGIAQGLAGARAGQQIQDFGAQLYGQNQDRAMQAAGMGADLQGQLSQAYQGLGQFGMGLPWYNMQQMRGLLGTNAMADKGGYSTAKGSSWNLSGGLGGASAGRAG